MKMMSCEQCGKEIAVDPKYAQVECGHCHARYQVKLNMMHSLIFFIAYWMLMSAVVVGLMKVVENVYLILVLMLVLLLPIKLFLMNAAPVKLIRIRS